MKEKIAELYSLLFGFRKFLVAMLVIVISIIFRIKALLSGQEFVDLVKAIALGFFGTNTAEGVITVVKNHLAARRAAGSVLATPDDKPDAPAPDDDVQLVLPGDK